MPIGKGLKEMNLPRKLLLLGNENYPALYSFGGFLLRYLWCYLWWSEINIEYWKDAIFSRAMKIFSSIWKIGTLVRINMHGKIVDLKIDIILFDIWFLNSKFYFTSSVFLKHFWEPLLLPLTLKSLTIYQQLWSFLLLYKISYQY